MRARERKIMNPFVRVRKGLWGKREGGDERNTVVVVEGKEKKNWEMADRIYTS